MTNENSRGDHAAVPLATQDCSENHASVAVAGDAERMRATDSGASDAVATAVSFMEEYVEVFEELAK